MKHTYVREEETLDWYGRCRDCDCKCYVTLGNRIMVYRQLPPKPVVEEKPHRRKCVECGMTRRKLIFGDICDICTDAMVGL